MYMSLLRHCTCPCLIYEVEFPDGEVWPYSKNIIAESIWSLVDSEGQGYLILEFIIDHHFKKNIAVGKENMFNGN